MGSFRFHRSIKIMPGIRLNIGRTGTSLSVGGRGLTTNVSRRGVKNTVGLSGSGLSYSWQRRWNATPRAPRAAGSAAPRGLVILFVAVAIVWYLLRHF
jgi:hypothetical protein